MRGQRHALAALYPRERPGTHCTGDWEGPRAGLDMCGKSRPPPTYTCDCDEYLVTRRLCLAAFLPRKTLQTAGWETDKRAEKNKPLQRDKNRVVGSTG